MDDYSVMAARLMEFAGQRGIAGALGPLVAAMSAPGQRRSSNLVDATEFTPYNTPANPEDFSRQRTWVYDPKSGKYVDSTGADPAVAPNYGGGSGEGVSPEEFQRLLAQIKLKFGGR
jgi:hypothetical protein